jgi:phosphohistidine phosphatase
MMGERLRNQRLRPDLLLSSSAKRARNTAEAIATSIGYPVEDIAVDRRLYLAEVDELIALIRTLDDRHQHVMLFGHNPGFTALANRLGASPLDNLPTCGIYGVELDAEHWREVGDAPGRLRFYDYPKRHKSEA